MHSLGVYYGCGVTCRFAIPAALENGGAQSEEALREHFERAVALTVLDHPLLQVGLAGESTQAPAWVRLDRIDLHNHIQWQTVDVDDFGSSSSASNSSMDAALEDVIKVQHDTPYPDLETRPGWKMVVLRSPHLDYVEAFFGVNHANADGESAKIFHQTLLEKLNLLSLTSSAPNDLTSCLSPEGVLTLPSMTASAFTPAHESLVNLSASVPWVLSSALKQIVPAWMRSHPLQPLPWALQRAVPVRTALRLVHLDAAALRQVLDACRCHDTTLTGLLQGMAVTSLAMRTRTTSHDTTTKQKKKSTSHPLPLVLGTPVSMRRYMRRPDASFPSQHVPGPNWTMVNSVTYCFHKYHGRRLSSLYDLAGVVPPTTPSAAFEDALWEQAGHVRRQLEQKLAKGTRNDLTALMGYISDLRGRLAEEMAAERPRDVTLEVSNLGVIDGSGGGRGAAKSKTPLQQTVMALKGCCRSSTSSAVPEKEGVAAQDSAVVVGAIGGEEEQDEEEGMGSQGEKEKWTIERAMFTQSGTPHGAGVIAGLVDDGVAAGLAADLEAWLGSLGRREHITFSGGRVKAG
ncbi:hypothetical protein PG997_006818 [Apiospora hydei]|uniref:Uncharacterized protein n=1 Tax=Apiospora hydei TaxID=1337664 RepID=A0ABR1WPS2_9PEZI